MTNTERFITTVTSSERDGGAERLTHHWVQQEVARTAILAVLLAHFNEQGGDSAFTSKFDAEESSPAKDIIDLLNLVTHPRNRGSEQLEAGEEPKLEASIYDAYDSIDRYREGLFTPPARRSDFQPAPLMAEAPLGPELPNLPFNDRIRPQNRGATVEDFKAAERANTLLQRSLIKQGWMGGEVTPEQMKAAERNMIREYHPDLPTTDAADADAIKMYNSNRARPVTPTTTAPASSFGKK